MNMNPHPITTVLKGATAPMFAHRFSHWLSAVLIVVMISLPSLAWSADAETKKEEKPAPAKKAEPQDDETKEKDAEEDKEKVLVIRGGDIQTVTNGMIREGTIVIRDGKIEGMGTDVEVPEDATVIDATGKRLTPGFVALDVSRIGLSRSDGELSDSLDPFDRNMKLALGVGITTAAVRTSGSSGRRGFRSDDGSTLKSSAPESDFAKADTCSPVNPRSPSEFPGRR